MVVRALLTLSVCLAGLQQPVSASKALRVMQPAGCNSTIGLHRMPLAEFARLIDRGKLVSLQGQAIVRESFYRTGSFVRETANGRDLTWSGGKFYPSEDSSVLLKFDQSGNLKEERVVFLANETLTQVCRLLERGKLARVDTEGPPFPYIK